MNDDRNQRLARRQARYEAWERIDRMDVAQCRGFIKCLFNHCYPDADFGRDLDGASLKVFVSEALQELLGTHEPDICPFCDEAIEETEAAIETERGFAHVGCTATTE